MNRFHVAMCLLINRSQMMSKCGKYKKVAHEPSGKCVTDVLTHFDIFCDVLLNRCTATWNLFVLYNKEVKMLTGRSFMGLSSNRSYNLIATNQNM